MHRHAARGRRSAEELPRNLEAIQYKLRGGSEKIYYGPFWELGFYASRGRERRREDEGGRQKMFDRIVLMRHVAAGVAPISRTTMPICELRCVLLPAVH
jgi:hypothetical protein